MTKTRIKYQLTADAWAKARKAEMPQSFEPMLATSADKPFSDDRWLFERHFEGLRLLVFRDGRHVELYTGEGELRNARFPELVELFASQPCERFVLDGKVVAFDGTRGRTQRLAQRDEVVHGEETRNRVPAIYFYVFDSPWIEDYDIRLIPLRERKMIIRNVLDFSGRLRYMAHRNGDGEGFMQQACAKGWDGMLAKQADSVYRSGRSKRWLKFRCVRDDG